MIVLTAIRSAQNGKCPILRTINENLHNLSDTINYPDVRGREPNGHNNPPDRPPMALSRSYRLVNNRPRGNDEASTRLDSRLRATTCQLAGL